MDLVFVDTWTYGDAVAPPEYRDRRLGWSDTWRKDGPGPEPYAHPISGLHCVIDVNSMEVLRIEDNGGVDEPTVMGEYVPKHIPERIRVGIASRAAQAAAPHPARRRVVHPRRQPAAMAELVAADRVQPPRRHDPAHDPLPRRRPDPLCGTPDLAGRDDRALPRLVRGPLPAHRIRHRRVGPRFHDDVAGVGLRLSRRDPLPGRGAAQQQGRAVHHHQRDLHPRGRQRRAVEARRPRRRAPRCGACAG